MVKPPELESSGVWGSMCSMEVLSHLLENRDRVYSPLGLEWLPESQVTYNLGKVLMSPKDKDTNQKMPNL